MCFRCDGLRRMFPVRIPGSVLPGSVRAQQVQRDAQARAAADAEASTSRSGPRSTVKPLTKQSLGKQETRSHLVKEYGFQPKRKASVEDGSVLPIKFEPFPQALYGKPLEEIDNFIYDEVSIYFQLKDTGE